MTASSADVRRRRAGTLAAAAAVPALSAAPAAAQQGPVRLFPSAPTSEAAPAPARPAPAPAPQQDQNQPQPPTESRGLSGITAAPLEAPGAAGVGLLEERTGGLPYRLWQGTGAELATTLVAKLPAGAPSPMMHELAYRLLASTAAAPQPTPGAPALLPLRVEKLRLMGEAPAASRLAEAVPEGDRSEAVRRALLDALLAQSTADAVPAEACPLAADGVRRFDGPYWQKASAFCALVEKRGAEAQLAIAMLRETGHEDAPFFWAADQLSGIKPASLKSLPAANPLVLAMARAGGATLPADALGDDAAPWLVASVARHGPAADRLALAERAAATGALPPAELAALYAAQTVPAPPAAPKTAADRAALWQVLSRQMDAGLLAVALEGPRFTPFYAANAQLYAETVSALPPTPGLAAAAGRALFAAARPDAARAWVQEARRAGDEAALRALWPYERVADAPAAGPFSPEMIAAWRGTQPPGTPKPQLDRRHTLVLGLLQALGEPVASADWLTPLTDATVDAAPVPDAAILRALDVAAAQGRIGETVALALVALGNEGPAAVHPEALFRAVAALKRVGLEREAKALALEAMAAAGV